MQEDLQNLKPEEGAEAHDDDGDQDTGESDEGESSEASGSESESVWGPGKGQIESCITSHWDDQVLLHCATNPSRALSDGFKRFLTQKLPFLRACVCACL
jgi:hypothetical protein